MTSTTEQTRAARRKRGKVAAKYFDDFSYTTGVQPRVRIFVGCTYCAYETGGGAGPCATIARATLSVKTPNGFRPLCAKHARGPFFAPGCGTDPHDDRTFSARPSR